MNGGGVDKACKSNAGCWTLETRNWNRYCVSVIQSYRDLEVYQESQRLFRELYQEIRTWPQLDQRELGSQLLRAANSIHANIAEGFGKSIKDFKRHLGMSYSSSEEVQSHLRDVLGVKLMTPQKATYFLEHYASIAKRVYRLRERWQ